MTCLAAAADQSADVRKEPTKAPLAKKAPAPEKPFFFINDNRITVANFPSVAVPSFSAKSNLITTAFTHFDAWAYGTNTFSLLRNQWDHSAPMTPCVGPAIGFPVGQCAGATQNIASLRSTLGWNELFGTNAFSAGPLTNISFLGGADVMVSNVGAAVSQTAVVAGLQFGFALPYKGYLNISPLYFQRWQYNSIFGDPSVVGAVFAPRPPYSFLPDGIAKFDPTWGVDLNYYMDLGFLPPSLQYFAISGRAVVRGADGTGGYNRNPAYDHVVGYALEPIRLTLDAGKLFWGPQYAHLVDVWAAWRYDRNITGFNPSVDPNCVTNKVPNGSCNDSGIYYGMTMKLGAEIPGTPSTSAFGLPFVKSVDNMLTVGVLPNATSPGATDKTIKQVYAFTHNDVWSYGTNQVYAELLKSDGRDPAAPCSQAYNKPVFGQNGPCMGEYEMNAKLRSTFGFNEVFNTTAFRAGPLRNVSLELGGDFRSTQLYSSPDRKAIVAGLQFAFDLPYKGYLNVAPLYYQEWNHSTFAYPNNVGNSPFGLVFGSPRYVGLLPAGFTGTVDGNLHYRPTWALEIDYGGELGFLPENLRYFSWSGHAGIYGAKGNGAYGGYTLPSSWNTATEYNLEPIRLTFDVSKAVWGPKYSHFLETFVAYRYWKNKYGFDGSNPASPVCSFANGASNNSCTEQTVYAGITSKF
ncbi:hypothetical protein FBZ93_120104 [Bradyrhizobium macuxiense]|uniref:Uncharacterized protein n=2 Tax=Bradyrhizobium macuxiense TaxID=1755647 RepID=A0A560KX37_9BRAD|nr:hypothetical protein FBZ93_120104 [Bradyrhizobium macuxiense]